MQSRVCVTVVCPSVCLSYRWTPATAAGGSAADRSSTAAGALRAPCSRRRRSAANAGSVTLPAGHKLITLTYGGIAASLPRTNRSLVFARWRQCVPHLIHGSLGQLRESVSEKRHLGRFRHFAGLTGIYAYIQTSTHTQADRQTTERATCAAVGRTYVNLYSPKKTIANKNTAAKA